MQAEEVGLALDDKNVFLLIRTGLVVEGLDALSDAFGKWVNQNFVRG